MGRNRGKLDLWDKRILYELDRDARAPFSTIAGKVKRSPQWVRYRIERLRGMGAIKHLYPIIDYGALGYVSAGLWIRLSDMGPVEETRFFNECYKERSIATVLRTEGIYDLYLVVFARGTRELAEFISAFGKMHGDAIETMDVALCLERFKFQRSYLLGRKGIEAEGISAGGGGRAEADEADRAVIDCINQDPRMGTAEIAKRCGIGRDAAIYRLGKLSRAGLIKGHTLQVNFRALGVQGYAIAIRTALMGAEEQKALYQFCRLSGKAVRLTRALGAFDFMIELESDSRDSCRWFYKELRRRFGRHLRGAELLYVFGLDKHRLMPIGGKL